MVKYKFTQSQFDEIGSLLKRRLTESRKDQKKTRAKIRKLGFKISDYRHGFTDLDFKKLLDQGIIEIVSKQIPTTTMSIKKSVFKPTISEPESGILKQALPSVIDEETEVLILGTMPGEQSLSRQQYYTNTRNQFWKIMEAIFNKKTSTDYSGQLTMLRDNKIGLWDVLHTCDREGSSDSNIKNPIPNNFDKLFKEYPKIKTLIFNGKESYNYFISLVNENTDKVCLQLSSTSSANGHKTLAEKTQEWKDALTKK